MNHLEDLTLFLSNPYLPIHNNKCEQSVGALVQLRRNSLTFKNEESCQWNLALLTIVMTVVKNRINVEKYLVYLFDDEKEIKTNPLNFMPWVEEISEKFLMR